MLSDPNPNSQYLQTKFSPVLRNSLLCQSLLCVVVSSHSYKCWERLFACATATSAIIQSVYPSCEVNSSRFIPSGIKLAHDDFPVLIFQLTSIWTAGHHGGWAAIPSYARGWLVRNLYAWQGLELCTIPSRPQDRADHHLRNSVCYTRTHLHIHVIVLYILNFGLKTSEQERGVLQQGRT